MSKPTGDLQAEEPTSSAESQSRIDEQSSGDERTSFDPKSSAIAPLSTRSAIGKLKTIERLKKRLAALPERPLSEPTRLVRLFTIRSLEYETRAIESTLGRRLFDALSNLDTAGEPIATFLEKTALQIAQTRGIDFAILELEPFDILIQKALENSRSTLDPAYPRAKEQGGISAPDGAGIREKSRENKNRSSAANVVRKTSKKKDDGPVFGRNLEITYVYGGPPTSESRGEKDENVRPEKNTKDI
jgi:hypothetical protein